MTPNEFGVEDATLEWLGELNYGVGHGPHLVPGEPTAERASFGEVVLMRHLREAIRRPNFSIPEEMSAGAWAAGRRATVAKSATVQTER